MKFGRGEETHLWHQLIDASVLLVQLPGAGRAAGSSRVKSSCSVASLIAELIRALQLSCTGINHPFAVHQVVTAAFCCVPVLQTAVGK